jgi:ribosome-binding ATPase YchF (GTP1/OBG family)
MEKVCRMPEAREALQVRAWTLVRGGLAPTAAGVINRDFEDGFLSVEVSYSSS